MRFRRLHGKMGQVKIAAVAVVLLLAAACTPESQKGGKGAQLMSQKTPKIECADCVSTPIPADQLPASEEEWKKKLTPEQFFILRQAGTETPYSGKYVQHWEDGYYVCAGCGQPLYDSKTKYDSCGWPSFWDAIPGAIGTRWDGAQEVHCSNCKGHLGHIFDDGPKPTGKRH